MMTGRSAMELFTNGSCDKIVIVYNKFRNAASQDVTTEQFLPIVPIESDKNVNLDYIFEPSKEGLLEYLIPSILQTQF